MAIKPPIIMSGVIAGLLVVGVWLAPERTQEDTRSVSLPVSTYNALVQKGAARPNADDMPMPVNEVIASLIAAADQDVIQTPLIADDETDRR